jgi:hypothetical protein
MQSPSIDGASRDHYSDRYQGASDNGGVHWNSGILNHWFYLLTEGGQHHNSAFRTGTSISGLGIEIAFDIWFQAWVNELDAYSTFDDARAGTLAACVDLGYDYETTCSSVQNAWAEVGLGSVYTPPPPPAYCESPPSGLPYYAGYGSCGTYAAGQPNYNYCLLDRDSNGILAFDACAECGKGCVAPPQPDCAALSAPYDAGYGDCSTYYYGGGNYYYCLNDIDSTTGLVAFQACAECDLCLSLV